MTAPWIMWGSDVSFAVIDGGGGGGEEKRDQLVRIDYARPESWQFFFYLAVQNFQVAVGAATVVAKFDLQIGVGRSAVIIPDFCQLELNSATSLTSSTYCNEVIAPFRNTAEQTAGTENRMKDFAAQSINIGHRTLINSPAGLGTADVVVAAWCVPKVHVRPEWFKDGNFTGGEQAGT